MSKTIDTALISYSFPCHKRVDDLLAVIPSVIKAANQSPPVEIVVIDYGNQEPLEPLLKEAKKELQPPNKLIVKTYRKRQHYHMGHARNMSVRQSGGEYVVIGQSDIYLEPDFFTTVRQQFKETGATYLRSMTTGYIGFIACQRQALLDIGGFDERFEFYGPEDKDLLHRLDRSGVVVGYYDLDRIIKMISTPDSERVANYRLRLSKREMSKRGRLILEDNDTNSRIVVNEGTVWGAG